MSCGVLFSGLKTKSRRLWLPKTQSARESCGLPHVAMVEPAHFWQLNNLPQRWSLYSPGQRGIAFQ